MADDANLNANASLGIDVTKFIRDMNAAITTMAKMRGQSQELDKTLDHLEQQAVKMTTAAKGMQSAVGDTRGTTAQTAAIQKLRAEANELQKSLNGLGTTKGRAGDSI